MNDFLQSALEAAGRVERPSARSADYISIAAVYCKKGENQRCLETLGLALEAADRIKQPVDKADCLAGAAALLVRAGDVARGKELFTRALLLARAAESVEKQATALGSVAAEYAAAGLGEEAAGVLASLYALVKSPDNGLDTACELIEIAGMYGSAGRPEIAGQMLEEAAAIALSLKDPWLKVERLTGIAEAWVELGSYSPAMEVLHQVETALNGIAEIDRAAFRLRIAEVYAAAGDKEKALASLKAALQCVELNEEAGYIAESLGEIAQRYFELGQKDQALALLDRSQQKSLEIEDLRDRLSVWTNNARALGWGGEKKAALELADKAMELCSQAAKDGALYYPGSLAAVYTGLGEKQKTAGAVAAISEAAGRGGGKTTGLGTLAVDLSEAGDAEAAVKLAGLITDPHTRAATLAEIAAGQSASISK